MKSTKPLQVPVVWIANLPDTPGLRLKVRGLLATGAGNEIERRAEKIPPKFRQAMGREGLKKRLETITADVAIEWLLVDWAELEDDDGAPVIFTAETARKLLNQYPRLLAAVLAAAAKADVGALPGDTASGIA